MYILVVYIPLTHKESVKEALFASGAGKMGGYEKCSFELEGTGQFTPLEGSSPFLGERGKSERVQEVRVEVVVPEECISEVIRALKDSHPYEVPAYHYYQAGE